MLPVVNARLPDIAPVAALPAAIWHELAERFRSAGFDAPYLRDVSRSSIKVYESLQRPLLLWHARRRRGPAAIAHRIFALRDPVEEDAAAELLGRMLMDRLLDAGMLIRPETGRVVSPFDCRAFMGVLVLCDDLAHDGDAVFGAGPGTAAFSALSARDTIALDLGCGAGGAALWLAKSARRVVATDVNPRALAFLAINAALNRIENVEAAQGDLFEPVAGEKFDVVISQPPFVPRPPAAPPATYRLAGPHGNELALRIISGVPRHLNAGGHAVIVFEQPVAANGDVTQFHAGLRGDQSTCTLLILGAEVEAGAYSIRHAAPELRRGIEAFDEAVAAMRDHLENIGIRGLHPAVCVVQRAPDSQGWFETVHAGDTLWNEISGGTIERLLAAQILLHRSPDRLSEARIRIPEGSFVIRPLDGSGGDNVHVGLAPGYLFASLELTPREWELLEALHGGRTVDAATDVIAKAVRAGLLDG